MFLFLRYFVSHSNKYKPDASDFRAAVTLLVFTDHTWIGDGIFFCVSCFMWLSLKRKEKSPSNLHHSILMIGILSSTVKVLRGRELTGAQCFSSINPVSNYERMRLHRRILGHLSAVYCIAFDRTGLRIFTVSWNLSTHPLPKNNPLLMCCNRCDFKFAFTVRKTALCALGSNEY